MRINLNLMNENVYKQVFLKILLDEYAWFSGIHTGKTPIHKKILLNFEKKK